MSMMEPFLPGHGEPEATIPAADPGVGAPAPAEGFGVAGEDPDVTSAEPGGDLEEQVQRRVPPDVPFRTPEPGQRA